MTQAYQLVIDLGTCHTVAVVRRAGEAPRPLLFDGSPLLPSGVYRDAASGRLVVGRDAERLAAAAPSQFEPYPKRTIDDGSVLLGDAAVPVVDLLAAILHRVTAEAAQLGGDPGVVTLTCPADWGPRRRELLLAAANAAGMARVHLVDEPIAAATYCVEVLGQQVPPGRCLLVFDFGGGTLDVTVVRREQPPNGLRVLAVGGLDDLGGVDVDAALVGHLGQLISLRAPQLWQRLAQPRGTGETRDRKAFWDQVRAAKEMLSRSASAPVPLPGSDDALHLTREELERVAGPLVDRAVDETRRVLQRAGVSGADLAGILLVGGSSRIPLVASRLHARFGIAPTVPEQPELPVAYGALVATPAPAAAAAGTGPHPAPVGRATAPVSPPGPAPAYAAQPGGPGPVLPTEVPGAAPGRSGRVVAIVLAVAIVVAGITWGGVYAARRIGAAVKHGGSVFGTGSGGGGALGGKSDGGDLKQFNGSPITISGSGVAGAVVGADAVYYATVTTGHTNVRAVPLPGTTGGPSWQQTPQLEPASLAMTLVNGLLILDGKSDNTANGKDVRVVLDAKTGKTRWKGEWSTFWQHDIAYLGTDVIFTNTFDNYVKRVRLTDGHTVWTHPEPADILADPYAKVPLAWPASIGTPIAAVPRSGKDAELPFQEPLVADGSRVVVLYSDDSTGEVLDTRTGHPLVRPGSLPLKADGIDDPWTVYDGLVIGADKGSAGLVGSGVGDLKQKWRYPLPAGADVRLVKACGQHLVCVSSEVGSGYQVMAVDTRNGTAAWSKPLAVDQEPVWYLAGQRVVYGDGTFASVGRNGAPASVLDPGKGTASPLGDSVSAYGGDGRYQSLVQTRVVSGRVDWLVSMVDIDTGKQTGWLDTGQSNTAPKVSVTGTGLAVLSGGGRLYLAQASGLAAR